MGGACHPLVVVPLGVGHHSPPFSKTSGPGKFGVAPEVCRRQTTSAKVAAARIDPAQTGGSNVPGMTTVGMRPPDRPGWNAAWSDSHKVSTCPTQHPPPTQPPSISFADYAPYAVQGWYWWNQRLQTTWEDPVCGAPCIVPSRPIVRAVAATDSLSGGVSDDQTMHPTSRTSSAPGKRRRTTGSTLSPWTSEEEGQLAALIAGTGTWDSRAAALRTGRSGMAVAQRWRQIEQAGTLSGAPGKVVRDQSGHITNGAGTAMPISLVDALRAQRQAGPEAVNSKDGLSSWPRDPTQMAAAAQAGARADIHTQPTPAHGGSFGPSLDSLPQPVEGSDPGFQGKLRQMCKDCSLKGQRLSVYWGGDQSWYEGRVIQCTPTKFRVLYDDGETSWEDVAMQIGVKFIASAPSGRHQQGKGTVSHRVTGRKRSARDVVSPKAEETWAESWRVIHFSSSSHQSESCVPLRVTAEKPVARISLRDFLGVVMDCSGKKVNGVVTSTCKRLKTAVQQYRFVSNTVRNYPSLLRSTIHN